MSLVNTDDFSKLYKNQVLAKATIGEEDFEDLSVSGDNPDPDLDGNPGNDSGFTLNMIDPGKVDTTEIKILIPEGISPNNDGLNDIFTLKDENRLFSLDEMGTLKVEIFNRWGSLIYKSLDYADDFNKGNGWYGQTNTEVISLSGNLPDGIYFYKVSSSNTRLFGGKNALGSITLQR